MTTLRRRDLLLFLPMASITHAQPGMGFPRDFGSHPESSLEWWYLTGILSEADDDKPRFGYQLTFFRLRGPAMAEQPSRFAARQLMLGHAALSDLSVGRLMHDQRIARAGFGLAEASETDCDVHIRDWSLRREAGGGYRARLRTASFTLDLHLKTTQAVLLQGEQGWSRKGPEQFSHYYSDVQLQTEAQLTLEGRPQPPLQGRSWLDHEWSQQFLGSQAVGWDWAGINLDDGGALTLFRLRRADGSVSWSGGSWRKPDGTTHNFEPEQIRMKPLRHWRSPASEAVYPVEWSLETPLGSLRMKALIDAQEIDARLSTGFRYWEGASMLESTEGRRLGLGYLELTGYAGKLRLP
jgi:predicted secreted hydrolase